MTLHEQPGRRRLPDTSGDPAPDYPAGGGDHDAPSPAGAPRPSDPTLMAGDTSASGPGWPPPSRDPAVLAILAELHGADEAGQCRACGGPAGECVPAVVVRDELVRLATR